MFKVAKRWLQGPEGRQAGPSGSEPGARMLIEDRLGFGRATAHLTPSAHEPATVETRSAERFVPLTTMTYLTVVGGKKVDARIINMSRLAVAVEAKLDQVDPATVIKVGAQPVKQGRPIRLGMVFRFEKPLDAGQCGPTIIL